MLDKKKIFIFGLLLVAMLGGCSSTKVIQQPNLNVSIGQQMIDLKKAYDSGALTEKEFVRQKERIIDNMHTY